MIWFPPILLLLQLSRWTKETVTLHSRSVFLLFPMFNLFLFYLKIDLKMNYMLFFIFIPPLPDIGLLFFFFHITHLLMENSSFCSTALVQSEVTVSWTVQWPNLPDQLPQTPSYLCLKYGCRCYFSFNVVCTSLDWTLQKDGRLKEASLYQEVEHVCIELQTDG